MTARDREAALARYGKMFDEAESEDELMTKLGSPTKAAICVLRGYVPTAEAPACPEEACPVPAASPAPPAAEAAPDDAGADGPVAAPEEGSPAPDAAVRPDAAVTAPAPAEASEPEAAPAEPAPAVPAEAAAAGAAAWQDFPVGPEGLTEPLPPEAEEPPVPEGRVSVWRVLLYVLLSAVVWLPVAVLLILLSVAVLGGGAAVIAAGVFTVSLGFTGITAVSDVMLLAGAGVVVAAVGLLAAFFGVWLFVRGAVGFINFAVRGAGWCRVSGEEAAGE